MRKMKTLAAVLLIAALTLGVFAACGLSKKDPNPDDTTVPEVIEPKHSVAVLKGPSSLGAMQIMNTPTEYKTTVYTTPQEVAAQLTANKVDFAVLPLNMASTLYNVNGGDIALLNIGTLGVLYILERGNSVNSIADLKGKTVYSSGQGATPEFVLDYVLNENNLNPTKDLSVNWLPDHAALSSLLLTGGADIALLPEPNASIALAKDNTLRRAIDLNTAWSDVTDGGKLAMSGMVVRRSLLKEDPEAVKQFILDYASSVNYVNGNPAIAANLAVKFGLLEDEELAKTVIPKCNLVTISGAEMAKTARENLKVLFDANAKSIGGAMPKDNFYYIAD